MTWQVDGRAKVGLVIGGGTLTALAIDPFEICDYGQAGSLGATDLADRFGRLSDQVRLTFVPFTPAPSFDMGPAQWKAACEGCERTLAESPDIKGFVLTHGTGALEEAAFFLSLVWDLDVPLIITGAQRPASAQSSDGPMNLFHAVKAATDPRIAGRTVLVAVNAELHDPLDVTKVSNTALDTFQSPWRGVVGRFTGARLDLFRPQPSAPNCPLISWQNLPDLPRVDILYCHSGADDTAVGAFVAAGAKGIVLAGFPPGYATTLQARALAAWSREKDGLVVAASRAGGRVPENSRNVSHGFIAAGPLMPVKARILLQLALLLGTSRKNIITLFDKVGQGDSEAWKH